jgi:adenylate kinase
LRLLFLGPPGAGKGTQAARVAARLGVPHISTGDMFRSQVAAGTPLGKRVKEIMESGGYVPDEVTVAMLAERIGKPDAAGGFILDGFPRTLPQVEALDALLGAAGLDLVVLFEVDEEDLVARMLARGRSDDTEETIRTRFKVYQKQTEPLIEVYENRGLIRRVPGAGSIEEITERVVSVLAASTSRSG